MKGTMIISVQDGSEYFRGLLLLLRMDDRLSESEIALMKRIGSSLGFEPGFCNSAIHDILDNAFVTQSAPRFSAPDLATKFLRDGITIALADGAFHPSEEAWLSRVAESNGLSEEWLVEERTRIAGQSKELITLEADALSVRYS